DLVKAVSLIKGKPDEIEPDGFPNPRGIPVSTLHFNIWYHLGLAYYLEGDLENAYNAYKECLQISDIPDKYVATAHWLYMTNQLLGKKEEAEKVLEKVTLEMDIIENQFYFKCLLMYKGEMTPEAILEEARKQEPIGFAGIAYGIANWFNYNKRKADAKKILDEIVATENWAAFGYIAAEADLKRLFDR
ncbi:MAG: tetratricopeptide repeat protein, partial [Candidatus Hermodarchaeota archaeon]